MQCCKDSSDPSYNQLALPSVISPLLVDMSRGLAGALPCVLLSHLLGLNSRYAKQLILGTFIVSSTYPQYTITQLYSSVWPYIQYAVITVIVFQLARWLLAPTKTATWAGKGRVLLIPGKTTHSRLFPKKHSFDYSYLVVGVPVGWEGIAGGMVSLSSAKPSWWSLSSRGWYHIDPEDYLTRGDRELGLRGKLDAYLKSQVCAPEVLQPDLVIAKEVLRGSIQRIIHTPTW